MFLQKYLSKINDNNTIKTHLFKFSKAIKSHPGLITPQYHRHYKCQKCGIELHLTIKCFKDHIEISGPFLDLSIYKNRADYIRINLLLRSQLVVVNCETESMHKALK